MWIARRARQLQLVEREARFGEETESEGQAVGPRPSDVTLFVRFERAGEEAMRAVLRRYAPDGTLSAGDLRAAVEPMVDSLRLATHAEAVAAAPELPAVHSPVEGGLVTCLRVKSRGPLPGLEDPTGRESLSNWLRRLAAYEPAKLLSVKLGEANASGGAGLVRELRPLHR
ncbi:MAG: hypothetical protein H5U40_00410 [Polyangiaceae bacterium]|nr:hypothetical protein [Polyangiaceae bacterium]